MCDTRNMDTNITASSCLNEIGTIRKSSNIGEALDLLRKELILLQEQDVLLLKQLINVNYSIIMLKRKLSRRTTLAPKLSLINSADCIFSKTLPRHSSFSRVMSEPSRTLIHQRSLSITEEEDYEEDDEMAESLNSGDSDYPLKYSLNVDPEVNALLTDMPKSLRRKYLTSLNHNSYAMPQTDSFDKLEEEKKLKRTFSRNDSMTNFTETDSTKNQICSSKKYSSTVKKLPIPKDLCSKPENGDYTYESDSSGGIEMTAL